MCSTWLAMSPRMVANEPPVLPTDEVPELDEDDPPEIPVDDVPQVTEQVQPVEPE